MKKSFLKKKVSLVLLCNVDPKKVIHTKRKNIQDRIDDFEKSLPFWFSLDLFKNIIVIENSNFKGDLFKKHIKQFINIKIVAKFLVFLCENKNLNGIINCCSGTPISIKNFVKISLKKRNSKIKNRIGNFKKPEHEPEQYWGSTSKMLSSSFKFENKFF